MAAQINLFNFPPGLPGIDDKSLDLLKEFWRLWPGRVMHRACVQRPYKWYQALGRHRDHDRKHIAPGTRILSPHFPYLSFVRIRGPYDSAPNKCKDRFPTPFGVREYRHPFVLQRDGNPQALPNSAQVMEASLQRTVASNWLLRSKTDPSQPSPLICVKEGGGLDRSLLPARSAASRFRIRPGYR